MDYKVLNFIHAILAAVVHMVGDVTMTCFRSMISQMVEKHELGMCSNTTILDKDTNIL